MKIYGLIGYPLSHSWSAQYFTEKFTRESRKDESYRLFPLQDIRDFPVFISSIPFLKGLNVTIPYKEKIIPFLNELDPEAKEIGAVNTIKIIRKGSKIVTRGYNTDANGFIRSLPSPFRYKNALVLGTGGGSKAIVFALKKLGINVQKVSRNSLDDHTILYQDVDDMIMNKFTMIINTTPLGMFPETEHCPPIPYQQINGSHFLYDLIYNPVQTLFLKNGKARGANIQNGLEMLTNQADLADQVFQEP
jgi:shikimate dehydrogenase